MKVTFIPIHVRSVFWGSQTNCSKQNLTTLSCWIMFQNPQIHRSTGKIRLSMHA